ncbi:MAG TPA: glycosyltransferase family 4 protein [Vicinamibacterales bacterium]|nr:glycosyltransferase family 4 protein [Vicinamibacterales bacterium]
MHVCFFNRSYWPDQAATGQLLTELAEDLVALHGCRVTVVAGRALHEDETAKLETRHSTLETRLSPFQYDEHNGVHIIRAAGTRMSPRRFAARATNYMTYFTSSTVAGLRVTAPDLVVSLTDPPIVGLTALWTARRTGAPFVFLCEDIFPEVAVLVEDFHNRTVYYTLDRINRHLLRQADAVIALGERMRARLVEEKGADPDRIEVIHNWADCQAIVPGDKNNEFARAHGLIDRFVLMHSGNVGLSQNLDVLVEAADLLRSRERLSIVIVGQGARREVLEGLVARKGLTNVTFLPYQSKEQLRESFAAADAFVISLKPGLEGYIVPSKLYGILAAGRPYVAAVDPSCEVAAIAREYECGVLAKPGDPVDLARKIAELYDDPVTVRKMGTYARLAAGRFDRHPSVQAYHDLFARVVAAHRKEQVA